ncbi:MAG: nuclear transport factor 2 family protein [Acidobacteriota bacterium]
MKKFIFLMIVILVAVTGISWPVGWAQSNEEAAVRVPLENYLKGHATGNAEYIRKAFHPDAKIFSCRDGKLNALTLTEFATRFPGQPAPDEGQRKRQIESIEITANAAMAKIVLDYPQVKFTDYMSLLKIDGEWKIINKTFYAEPKKQSQ